MNVLEQTKEFDAAKAYLIEDKYKKLQELKRLENFAGNFISQNGAEYGIWIAVSNDISGPEPVVEQVRLQSCKKALEDILISRINDLRKELFQ